MISLGATLSSLAASSSYLGARDLVRKKSAELLNQTQFPSLKLAVSTPRGIELHQDILVVVNHDVIESAPDHNLDRLVIGFRGRISAQKWLQFTSDKGIQPLFKCGRYYHRHAA